MSNGSSVGGIVGAGLNIIALGMVANVAMQMVKQTGKMASSKSRVTYKPLNFDRQIARMLK